MKISIETPFREFIIPYGIKPLSPHYAELERLYAEIQQIQFFIFHSSQFQPIGKETAKLFLEHFERLRIPKPNRHSEKSKTKREIPIAEYIECARQREIQLTAVFIERLLKSKGRVASG
jgi:hypothetical protein